ncbi:MAG: M48 family metallopeptidase [Candidatus Omnitrophota bacterium]
MWELIEANKRKSWIIFIGMGLFLLILGYVIGMVWFGPDYAAVGIVIAGIMWFVLSLVSYSSGDSILLWSSRAKEVAHSIHPRLFNVVEEMKIAANLPKMPKIYIIDDPAPNAFATGKTPEGSSIAVTAGLLSQLNRDELQGVIAHEMSHILNRDVLYVTFAGVMLGSIVMLSEIFLRSLWYGGSSRRYRSNSKGGGQAQIFIFIIAIVLAILAPLLAQIFYFSLSRKREYLADASAVRLSRYPEGLASALEKISSTNYKFAAGNKVTAPMYIVNPLQSNNSRGVNLFSTHPPTDERVKILRNMAGGVNYLDYHKSLLKVNNNLTAVMPPSALRDSQSISIRKPTQEQKQQSKKQQVREVGDLMRVVNNYAFLLCACGLRIKVPPDYRKPRIVCPRCSKEHNVPGRELKEFSAVLGGLTALKSKDKVNHKDKHSPNQYIRKGTGWESFSCSCGEMLQVSPLFMGAFITCHNCGNKTEVKSSSDN